MKEIQNIVVQISQEQHLSEERFVCNFKINNEDKMVIVNKNDLSPDELLIYESFITLINNKI